jgi:hypothetical protein
LKDEGSAAGDAVFDNEVGLDGPDQL